jgi:hypothetical protein
MRFSIDPLSSPASSPSLMAIEPIDQVRASPVARARRDLQVQERMAHQRDLEAKLHTLNAEAARWNLVEAEARAMREAELAQMDAWMNGWVNTTRGFSSARNHNLHSVHQIEPLLHSPHLAPAQSASGPQLSAQSSSPMAMAPVCSSMPHFLETGKDSESTLACFFCSSRSPFQHWYLQDDRCYRQCQPCEKAKANT